MWRVAGPCDSMYVCSMRVSFIISLLKSNLNKAVTRELCRSSTLYL